MMEINLDPVIIALGPVVLTWHGLLSAVGVLVGTLLTVRLAEERGVSSDDVFAVTLPVVVGGIAGARLLFVLENWRLFAERPLAILALNEGGISVFGAVIGGGLAGALYARRVHVSVALLADRAGIGFLLGQGIGRIGDIINGEHHGREAPGLPWSVTYTHPNTLGEPGVAVHPAVAYEMVYDLLAAALLVWALRRRPADGMGFLGFLFLYGLGRLWVGFFRKDTPVFAGLGMAQLIGLGAMLLASIWWYRSRSGTHPRPRLQAGEGRSRLLRSLPQGGDVSPVDSRRPSKKK